MSLPTLSGVGRLIDAPELRFTSTGKAVAKVRLAFNSRRRNDAGEWVDADVYFVDGTVWDKHAENAAESLNKGDEVIVTGLLKTRKYETKDGEKRSVTELAIQSIGPSLAFATAKPQKAQRGDGPNGRSGGNQWAGASAVSDEEPPF